VLEQSSNMALHALQDVDDALATTRAFLFPFELRRWLKLALIALFVGGGVSLPTAQFNTTGGFEPDTGTGAEVPSTIPADALSIVIGIAAIVLLLWFVFGLIGAIAEFVLVESLRTGEVTLRRHGRQRLRQGLRLFGFRIAIGIPFLVLVGGWIGLLVGPEVFDIGRIVPVEMLLLLGIPIILLVGLLYAIINAFTTAFVVPIAIKMECGILAGWRRLWGSIKTDPKEYLVYAVVGLVLSIATGIAASIVVGLVAIGLLLPLAVIGIVVHVSVSLSSTVGLAILVVLGGLFVLALLVCWLLVQVPVVTYLRYYALLVLGDVDESLDLIPEQRRAARE
jgi:hypothetical protein